MGRKTDRGNVEHLAAEYLPTAAYRRRSRWLRSHFGMDELVYAVEHLRQADEVLDFLRRSGRDPYTTLVNVEAVLKDAERGLQRTKSILDETRLLELLDDHLETLMRALNADALPGRETEALTVMGFPHLARSIEARADVLGQEWRNGSTRGQDVAREYRRAPATGALDAAIGQIERHRAERAEFAQAQGGEVDRRKGDESPKKTRKWWKGIGQIVQGGAIAGADVGLLIGVLDIPMPDGGETYGAVMSVTAGIGTILSGVGDLWGE